MANRVSKAGRCYHVVRPVLNKETEHSRVFRTCFWAGDTFTPKLIVDGQPIQQYLQEKFLKSWQLVAEAVGGLEAVVGFDVGGLPFECGI